MDTEITTIDAQAEPESTPLTVVPATRVSTIIAADTNDILGRFAAEFRAFKPDASTEEGRKAIGSMKRKAGVARQDLLRLAKTLREDADKTIKGIQAETKIIDENFDAIIDAIEAPLVAYKAIEQARVAAHEAALSDLTELAFYDSASATPESVTASLQAARTIYVDRDWQEFTMRAGEARAKVVEYLMNDLAAVTRRVEEAAELERFRAERAERDRQEAARLQAEREAQIAAEAAETARRQAEELAKAEAERVAKAVRDVQEALDRQAKADRQRAEKAERDAAEEAAEAERRRVADAAQAEFDRLNAIAAERKRVADEAAAAKAAEEARAADLGHRKLINNEALFDMVDAIPVGAVTADEICKAIIAAVARGKVRHCKIEY